MTRPGLSPAAAALAALTAIVATAWLIVQLTPGAATELREQLAFAFERQPADLQGAAGLASNNFKVCALALTGAAAQLLYATSPRPRTAARWVFDTVLGVAYLANAAPLSHTPQHASPARRFLRDPSAGRALRA